MWKGEKLRDQFSSFHSVPVSTKIELYTFQYVRQARSWVDLWTTHHSRGSGNFFLSIWAQVTSGVYFTISK